MSMVNCIRFKPKVGCESIVIAETSRIYKTLDGALEKRLVSLSEGEYASVIVWKSMDAFLEVSNRAVKKPFIFIKSKICLLSFFSIRI